MAAIVVKEATTLDERAKLHALRHAVFVGEQRVPEELERDEHDAGAVHVIALDASRVCVGTGRLVRERPGVGRVGRMAVHRLWRRRGVGDRLIEALERIAREGGLSELELHAQVHVEAFYAKHGYARAGEVFLEAGIEHVLMRKVLHLG